MTIYHPGKLYRFKNGYNYLTDYTTPIDNEPFVLIEFHPKRITSVFHSAEILLGKKQFRVFLRDQEIYLLERLSDNEKE